MIRNILILSGVLGLVYLFYPLNISGSKFYNNFQKIKYKLAILKGPQPK